MKTLARVHEINPPNTSGNTRTFESVTNPVLYNAHIINTLMPVMQILQNMKMASEIKLDAEISARLDSSSPTAVAADGQKLELSIQQIMYAFLLMYVMIRSRQAK